MFSDPHVCPIFLGFVHSPKRFMKHAYLMQQNATIPPNLQIPENDDPTNSLEIHTNDQGQIHPTFTPNFHAKKIAGPFFWGPLGGMRGLGRDLGGVRDLEVVSHTPYLVGRRIAPRMPPGRGCFECASFDCCVGACSVFLHKVRPALLLWLL